MDKSNSKMKQFGGMIISIVVMIAKLPLIFFKAFINPMHTLKNIIDTIELAFERDSSLIKAGIVIISIPALITLTPLSIIQAGLKKLYQVLFSPSPSEPTVGTDIVDTSIGNHRSSTAVPLKK